MSTSRSYLRKRLKAIGRDDLVQGAEAGLFSFHAAAIDAGLIKEPAIAGNGSPNAAKRAAYAIWKATRQSPPLNGSTAPTMPDLAAALAEVEAMRGEPGLTGNSSSVTGFSAPYGKPHHHAEVVERDRLIGIIERLENRLHDGAHAYPALPCTTCPDPCAPAAMKEVVDVYVAARRGEQDLAGNVLPRACCKRQLKCVDARALIA
jgi:hypothetical protein